MANFSILNLEAGSAAAPGLSFNGDSNTGIFSAGADSLSLATTGNERVTINSSGYVGIGTTDPDETFSVNSNDAGGNDAAAIRYSVNNSGSVFGTSTLALVNLNQTANTWARIGFADDNNPVGNGPPISSGIYGFFTDHANDYGDIGIVTRSAAGLSEKMRINSIGNVGIGTTAPSSQLEVSKSQNAATVLSVSNSSAGASAIAELGLVNDIGLRGGLYQTSSNYSTGASFGNQTVLEGNGAGLTLLASPGNVRVFSGGSSANNEKLTVLSSGNIGISDSNPGARLDVTAPALNISYSTPGTSKGSIHISPENSANGYSNAITFGANDGTSAVQSGQAGIYVQSSSSYGTRMHLATTDSYGSGSKVRLSILETGSVGIGTTTPGEKLDIEGSILSGPKGTATGEGGAIKFEELATNGTHSVGFRAPDAITASVLWQLPAADGTSGQVLQTNGSGVLTWVAQSGGADNLGNHTATTDLGMANFSILNLEGGSASAPGLSFNSDSNTGIFSAGADSLSFATAGNERLTIDASGNIGVGIPNPGSQLSFGGNQNQKIGMIRGTNSANNGFNLTIEAGGPVSGTTNKQGGDLILSSGATTGSGSSSISFYTAGGGGGGAADHAPSRQATIDGEGRFYLNDTSPDGYFLSRSTDRLISAGTFKLEDNAGSSTYPIVIKRVRTGGTPLGNPNDRTGIDIILSAETPSHLVSAAKIVSGWEVPQVVATSDQDSYLGFFTTVNANDSERMRISSNGSVGIGTDVPGEKLDVEGSILSGPKSAGAGNGGAIKLEELAANGTHSVGFRAPDSVTASVLWQLPAADGTSGQVLQTNGSGVLTWATAGGGSDHLGNHTATTMLDLAGYGIRDIDPGDATSPGLSFFNDANTGIFSGAADSLSLTTAGNEALTITSAGRVGIGTTLPSYEFVVMSDGDAAEMQLESYGSDGSELRGWRAEDTDASPDAVTSDERLLRVSGGGWDGSSSRTGKVYMDMRTDENWSPTNNGTEISFWVTANTTQNPAKAVTINNNSRVGIGTDAPGEKLDVEGSILSGPKGTATGEGGAIKFEELAINGTHSVGFRAPDSVTANVLWQLPAADGTSGQVLQTNGSGVLSWVAQSGGSDHLGNHTATATLDMDGYNLYDTDGGSAAAPGISFFNDPNTGIFSAGADSLSFATAGTEAVTIDSSGEVGIGIASPAHKLSVYKYASSAVANVSTALFYQYTEPNANSSQTYDGLITMNESAGGNDIGILRSLTAWTTHNGTGTVTSGNGLVSGISNAGPATALAGLISAVDNTYAGTVNKSMGVYAESTNENSGTISIAAGVEGLSLNKSTGSITTAVGASGEVDNTNAGGTITTAQGGYFNIDRTAGTVTTGYGVYIDDTDATNQFGLYQAGANDSNYFAGNVGIGTSTPRTTLDVNGAIAAAPAVTDTAGTIDFSSSNFAYTASNCGAFALHNMKDGATYTLAIQGTAVQTCSFNAYSGAGSGALTVKMPPGHGATTNLTETIYSFVVIGSKVYVSWVPGY